MVHFPSRAIDLRNQPPHASYRASLWLKPFPTEVGGLIKAHQHCREAAPSHAGANPQGNHCCGAGAKSEYKEFRSDGVESEGKRN